MCGIVGIINFKQNNIDKDKLIKMNNILIHRGPDYGDVYIEQNIGLGHRRLSIIDLSSEANQPFRYGDYIIVYNGEVYNYLELKEELIKKGYKFQTSSDTEVVLVSYIEWKEKAFHKFNGMWAFAIYDTKNKKLIICRDRFGVKPLYYYQNENKFLFASEKKAIVLSDFVRLEFDYKGIRTALHSPFVLEASGYTEFKNVKSLLPGHMLKIKQGKIDISQWYSLVENIRETIKPTFKERIKEFQVLFKDACSLRLRSDVPIATSLSGGLDSSSIVAVLSKVDTKKHKTFVHSFKGTELDETEFATYVSETTNTPMRIIEIDKEKIPKNIDEIIYMFESIYGGMPDSAYRIYKAQKADGYKISIDGHGADEMLGGYNWYLDEMLKDISLWRVDKILEVYKHKKEIINNTNNKETKQILRFFYNRLPDEYKKIIRKNILKKEADIYTYDTIKFPSNFSNLRKKLYMDFCYTVLPRILKNFDAVSMANSIEVRMPFLDYRLVEYIFALPNEDLINKRWTKYILRMAMNDTLDKRVNWRKDKKGFNSPISEMMSHELKDWTLRTIENSDNIIFNKDVLLNEFKEKILNNTSWGDSLDFWKKINTLKLIEIYTKRKINA